MPARPRIEVTDEFLLSRGHTRESYNALSNTGQWSVRNREKHAAISKIWSDKNIHRRRELSRKCNLKRMYGIDQAEYNRMFEEQDGKCAICSTATPTGKWKVFAVDHCHETGLIRGLLCNECNRGIGLLGDNPDRLLKAVDYLKTARERKGLDHD